MMKWLRKAVYPHLVYGFCGIYLFLELYGFLFSPAGFNGNIATKIFIVVTGAFIYGAFRISEFHPFYKPDYREWLKGVPWNYKKPLPNGPWHFVWQDVFILAVLLLLLWRNLAGSDITSFFNKIFAAGENGQFQLNIQALLIATSPVWIFLSVYLICAIVPLPSVGEVRSFFLILFVIGLVVRITPYYKFLPVWFVIFGNIFVYYRLKESLKRFPWDLKKNRQPQINAGQIDLIELFRGIGSQIAAVGWPYNSLSPKSGRKVLSVENRILISLLVGWYMYVFVSFQEPSKQGIMGFSLVMVSAMAVIRYILYVMVNTTAVLPPYTFIVRIMTFRYIIPRYHQIMITPLVCAGTMYLVPKVLLAIGMSHLIVYPVMITVCLMIVLLGGPSREKWRLTGSYRSPFFTTGNILSQQQRAQSVFQQRQRR